MPILSPPIFRIAVQPLGLRYEQIVYDAVDLTVHMAMFGRVFIELNALGIPARFEYAERQNVGTRHREPELRLIEKDDLSKAGGS